ncbi:MAG: hypothetical protein WA705_24205 [Candidatus Ozemobacteraceae bacterium]
MMFSIFLRTAIAESGAASPSSAISSDPEAAMLSETPLAPLPMGFLPPQDTLAPLEKDLRERAKNLPPITLPTNLEGLSIEGLTPIVEEISSQKKGLMPVEFSPASAALPTEVASRSHEDWLPLPVQSIVGAPIAAATKAAQKDEEKSATLIGRLIPEEQPVARRRFFRRWAIETDNGNRFPLTSTLQLLTAVKQPGILDGNVRATGKWVQAVSEERLKFFNVETIRPMGDTSENASGSKNLGSSSTTLPAPSEEKSNLKNAESNIPDPANSVDPTHPAGPHNSVYPAVPAHSSPQSAEGIPARSPVNPLARPLASDEVLHSSPESAGPLSPPRHPQ